MQGQTNKFLRKAAALLLDISKERRKIFLLLLLFSPGIWQIFFKPLVAAEELLRSPSYMKEHIAFIFSQENLRPIEEMRGETWLVYGNGLVGRVFYNKLTLLAEEFFEYTTYISVRLYFFTPDGFSPSPQVVEAIPAVLFPFWILGIFLLLKKNEYKQILILLLLAFLAFATGRKSLIFLLPVLIFSVYIASEGIWEFLKVKQRRAFLTLFLVYSTFLLGRFLWLGI